MKFKIVDNLDSYNGTILIPCFETNAKSILPIEYLDITVSSKVFFGKKDSSYIVQKNESTLIFIGIGKDEDFKSIQTIFRRIAHKNKDILSKDVAFVVPDNFQSFQIEAAFSGLQLGTYNLGHFKKSALHPFLNEEFELAVFSKTDCFESVTKGLKIASAQLAVFNLVDLPPNVVTPKYLADWAQNTGNKFGFTTKVLGHQECIDAKLDAFVAVGKGSDKEMQFVIMSYEPENLTNKTKHIGLIGKGITFDTGGLNIKTIAMHNMKCDMAGGGAVFGAMQLIADLKLDIKITAIVPCCENAVDSKSYLPSDVIGSYSGHSIEIIDTDAEGRLILADGLSYLIKNYKPEIIVDIATLTGSSIGTFSTECGALFTNNTNLANQLQAAGDAVGERLWQLPLWDCYKSDIESEIADVKNYSGKPNAGAISAAKFLEYFTENHTSWAHLDIAGMAFGDDEFAKTKHATGFGVHLLTKFIENL